MDPQLKRKIRLVVALSAAVLLAAGLVYTSFSASSDAAQPSDVLGSESSGPTQLTGRVAEGSVQRREGRLLFEIADRDDPSASLPVVYSGQIPDPFREGREVIVTGQVSDGTFLADKDSLITKCPSKFQEAAEEDPEHVIIVE